MDFFITFQVGYIFSPKCPLSKAKIMLETYTRPRGRCFLVSIKKFKTCIFRRKFLATTICHLATENFYPVASCRPYEKVNFGPCLERSLVQFSLNSLKESPNKFQVESSLGLAPVRSAIDLKFKVTGQELQQMSSVKL